MRSAKSATRRTEEPTCECDRNVTTVRSSAATAISGGAPRPTVPRLTSKATASNASDRIVVTRSEDMTAYLTIALVTCSIWSLVSTARWLASNAR